MCKGLCFCIITEFGNSFVGNIYDVKMTSDGQTVKASRWAYILVTLKFWKYNDFFLSKIGVLMSLFFCA